MGDQTKSKIASLDLAMAEALELYDVASKNGATLLQAKMLRLIAHLRAAQKAAT